MKRILFLLTAFLILSCSNSFAFISVKYDLYFNKYTRRYFSQSVDWKWFKCQAAAESGVQLNPLARSYVGAIGVMQLMPTTSAELARELGVENVPTNPEINIMLGIYYDYKLYRMWKECKYYNQLAFTFASYNAGPGNIIKANRKAPDQMKYTFYAIKQFLVQVTGRYSRETITYVERIRDYYSKLTGINVTWESSN